MRVNIYAEEMTERVEIISKEIDGHKFTGLRLYLELPVTVNGVNHSGPFMHREGDDDSAAVTFWGKRDLRQVLRKMLFMLDKHYEPAGRESAPEELVSVPKELSDRAYQKGMDYLAKRGTSWSLTDLWRILLKELSK